MLFIFPTATKAFVGLLQLLYPTSKRRYSRTWKSFRRQTMSDGYFQSGPLWVIRVHTHNETKSIRFIYCLFFFWETSILPQNSLFFPAEDYVLRASIVLEQSSIFSLLILYQRANSFVHTTQLWQKCDYLWRICTWYLFAVHGKLLYDLLHGQRLIPFPYATSAANAVFQLSTTTHSASQRMS